MSTTTVGSQLLAAVVAALLILTGCSDATPGDNEPETVSERDRAARYFDTLLERGLSDLSYSASDTMLCDSLENLLWALPDLRRTDPYEIHTRQAARHLLAKVYVATGRWHSADVQTTLLISYSGLSLVTSSLSSENDPHACCFTDDALRDMFCQRNMPLTANTERIALICPDGLPALRETFDCAERFGRLRAVNGREDATDVRYACCGDADPLIYKHSECAATPEYAYLFRLAETYLLRAEARFMMGRVQEAATDVNIVRVRANCSILMRADMTLEDIHDEYVRELSGEPSAAIS